MSVVTRVLAVSILVVGLGARIAAAQSCAPVLQGHQAWVETQPNGPGTYTIGFVMVSNRLSQTAAYAEGGLELKNTFLGKFFTGTGKYYLNTERWTFPCSGGGFCPEVHPFDPTTADPVTVTINPNTGRAGITTGGSTRAVDLLCDNYGVLYGVAEPVSSFDLARPMYVFSLKRNFVPQIY